MPRTEDADGPLVAGLPAGEQRVGLALVLVERRVER
jgi:hypothetical protein